MRVSFISILCSVLFLLPHGAAALTVDQLLDACDAAQQPCQNIPWVQAYMGGGFDLIASLQEQTDHLSPVYCTSPRQLFDVPAVAAYLESRREQDGDKNAMLIFVRYLRERGGC